MVQYLPVQYEALCNDAYYICGDENFKMNTAGGYRVARASLGKRYISFKLHELLYLFYTFCMVRNQLTRYTETMNYVLNYVPAALYSDTYVQPPINASKAVLYYQVV